MQKILLDAYSLNLKYLIIVAELDNLSHIYIYFISFTNPSDQ